MSPSAQRDDWIAEDTDIQVPFSPLLRQELAKYWLDVAALEHASVASFARFTLQLMGLGAPADLITEVQKAASDEVRHARLAYGVASAYAHEPLGPSALELENVTVATDLEEAVRSLVEEACFGETLGAAEAQAAAEFAVDPALTRICDEIARDE
ncbi:MAG: ferritin-like domain-containing protein, partial [Actinomycetota bacterium]|nr:ferritin-like domain-containing protein [Actinomycetota bacterium]